MKPVLTIDLGGTKTAVALVAGSEILASCRAETPRAGPPESWIESFTTLAEPWRGRFDRAGIAATGSIRDGAWTSLNPAVLPVPAGFPLAARAAAGLGVPVVARNDAQAAAWGEYRFGAGRGQDMIFLTVSTGIGGGIVHGGRLLSGRNGLAGHVGIGPVETRHGTAPLESLASGGGLASHAEAAGRSGGAPAVLAAAEAGDPFAESLLGAAVAALALRIRGLQLEIDPDLFVIGGGLGLAPAYFRRLQAAVAEGPDFIRPVLRTAALGAEAGLIGIADLVSEETGSA